MAYELQSNRLQQLIRSEQKQIELVERRKLIEIEQHEIERKEMELNTEVRLPAESQAYCVLQQAEATKTMKMEQAEAETIRIRLIGEAEVSLRIQMKNNTNNYIFQAYRIALVGKAEAEGLRLRAKALASFEDAALLALIFEALPAYAKALATPLSKTADIVIVNNHENDGNFVNGLNQLLAQVPPSVQALAGVNIKE